MKKLMIAMMAISLVQVSCSGDDDDGDGGAKPEKCLSTQDGATKCADKTVSTTAGESVWVCQGGVWVFQEDCAAAGDSCDDSISGFAKCKPPVQYQGEFESCTGSGQGNCEEGMTCMDWTGAPGNFYLEVAECITECTGPADCDAGQICEDELFGWCLTADGARLDPCGMNGHDCAGTLDCTQANDFGVPVFDCRAPCPGNEVNQGQGSCEVGEECLASFFVELEGGAAAWVDCSANGDTDCTQAQGFFCENVQIGASVEEACMRYEGLCGAPVAALHDFSEAGVDAWITEGTSFKLDNLCGVPGLDQFCAPEPGATAEVRCESLPYVAVESETPCNSSADCSWDEGFACIAVTSGDLCAAFLGTCVPYCDDIDGIEQTCPAGTDCLPAPDNGLGFPFPFVEPGAGGAAVTCDGVGQDGKCNNGTYTGFSCTGFGASGGSPYYCARPRKVCQTI